MSRFLSFVPTLALATTLLVGGCKDDGPESSCFAAGTPIATPAGPRPIEALSPGDTVYAFDHARGERVEAPVVRVFVHGQSRVRPVAFEGGVALATREHPFFAGDVGGYVKREALRVGMALLGVDGERHAVTRIGPERKVDAVYNLEVGTHHNYFAAGVLVHNKTFDMYLDGPEGDMGSD